MQHFRLYLWVLFITGVLTLFFTSVTATHLMGGELTYTYNSSTLAGRYYDVKLLVYRYCDSSSTIPAELDTSMMLGVFVTPNPSAPNLLNWSSTWNLPLVSATIVGELPGNANCLFQPTACVQRGEYALTVFLPNNIRGHHLIVERCCRNGNIVNLDNPGFVGMTFYTFVPPGIINSSPQISDMSVSFICSNDTTTIINNAYDPDGDSLAYSFVTPYAGTSGNGNNAPDPATSSPYYLPIIPLIFAPGYSLVNVFGATGYASIHPGNGMTRYFIPNQGLYVVAIEIKEYRNGVLIGAIRRDLQYATIVCPPNPLPVINSTVPSGIYTVAENQQLCFIVTATDVSGDSLFLFAEGPLLNSGIVNPAGVISDAAGAGIVTSTFCWTPVCGMSRLTPYEFFVTVVDNGCPPKSNIKLFSVYVTGGTPSVLPTVTIHSNQSGVTCQGSPVILNATCNVPGISPLYSWFVNGVPDLSSTDSIFSSSNLVTGDIVTVTVVSNASCLITNSATSPPYVVNVVSQLNAQVSISSFPLNLCPYQNCVFTATVNNGGASPSYQWYLNGIPSGIDLSTYSASTAAGYISVYVELTPSTGCPPQISNTINYFVGPMMYPSISIWSNNGDSICMGQDVIIKALASNMGLPPTYEWFLNGISVGVTSSDSIVLNNINDGDLISVTANSAYSCLFTFPVHSDSLTFYHIDVLELNLTDGPLEVCTGKPVLLEAATTGGNSSVMDFYWSAGSSNISGNVFVPEFSGYYFVIADDHCHAPVSDSVYIEVLPAPLTDFYWTPEQPSEFLPDVSFTDASVNAIQWQWNFGGNSTSNLQHPWNSFSGYGEFPVELITTNDLGCNDTLVKILEIEKALTMYIPNSFTPNNDGVNDEFGVVANEIENYSISIYNRWGKEVFFSSSLSYKWDGRSVDGKKAPSGSYVYRVKVSENDFNKTFSGTVSLIR